MSTLEFVPEDEIFTVNWLNDEDKSNKNIIFLRKWMQSMGYQQENLTAIVLHDDSMAPRINIGGAVAINTADRAITDGNVYAFNHADGVIVRRLVNDEGVWWMVSDNPDRKKFPKIRYTENKFDIIGRAIYFFCDVI